jgi:1L-myo-inositol 1-phosphate cytidylyltransferase
VSVNKAVILAAGNGSRISSISAGLPKPLVRLNGKPLLQHVMARAHEAGISDFVIIVGHQADAIRGWYARNPMPGVNVEWVLNADYHKNNGVSLLKAKDVVHDRFLLLMSDHIFDCATAERLIREPMRRDEVILAVDRNINDVFDIDDATKVRCEGKYIVDIGKTLPQYDALDTGMFLCSPIVFLWLEAAMRDGNCSLSDGLRLMASGHTFRAFDIGDASWQDVDTPEALDWAHHVFAGPRSMVSESSSFMAGQETRARV